MLSGLVVAPALIPEAISFSIIVGVDPSAGLLASFTMAVVVLVSFETFDWHSIAPKTLRRMPAGEITVMVVTGTPAIGVVLGTITAMVVFARRVAHVAAVSGVVAADGSEVVRTVTGELFFASGNDLVHRFDYANDPHRVVNEPSARMHGALTVT